MTVSQSKHEILWEPEDPHEALADPLASLRVDGGEIDHEEAVAIFLQKHRK